MVSNPFYQKLLKMINIYDNIINYINKQKPISVGSANANSIEYETALDKYTSLRDLYNFIDEYITELTEIQKNQENIFSISILSDFDPSQELKRINDIFDIIEEKHRISVGPANADPIYPRMYLYLHKDFSAIRDAAQMVNKIDVAIDIFNDLKDRVGSMSINGDKYVRKSDSLKTVLDDTNPVIGYNDHTYNDDINEFVEIYAFMIDKIVEHDKIIAHHRKLDKEFKGKIVDLSSTTHFDGFICMPPVTSAIGRGFTISHVDILSNLLHLMEANNVTLFWSKEINDVVESSHDYTADWGYFTIHVPDTFKIEIPEQLREGMFKYVKFLSDQYQKYTSHYAPQFMDDKSEKYFGISKSDEFLYEFNNEARDLLFDVYTYNALIYKNHSRLSKERFDKLLDMIDRTHGIISHNHIIIKFMLYCKILNNMLTHYQNNTLVSQLLSLFELLYDYDHFTGNKDDIVSFIRTIERKYKISNMRRINDREFDKYESRLFCMAFNCSSVEELINNLLSKL